MARPHRSADELRILSPGEGEDALRRNERRFRSLLEATTDGVWVADVSGRLLSDLPMWREFTGQTPDELLGWGWLAAIHPEDRSRAERFWTTAVAERSLYDNEYRICNAAGESRIIQARGAPVREDDGSTREWIGFVVDVTERRRAEAAERTLHAALESERRILEQVIAESPMAVAVVWGPDHVLRVFNERYHDLIPRGRTLETGRPIRELLPEVEGVLPLLDRARAGETLRLTDLAVPFDDERSFDGHRYYDVVYAPVLEDGGPGGVVALGTETTEEVRRRSTLERRLEDERRLAEQLQRALLPDAVAPHPGLEIAVRYLPGSGAGVSVGGDWYDAIALGDGRVAVVIGDVGGRGVEAARVMSQLRGALRAYVVQGLAPAAALAELARLCACLELADLVTVGVGIVDLGAGTLTYAGAGHLPPVVVTPQRGATLAAIHRGAPIGAPATDYRDDVLDLPPGSLVVLCTDGLVEQRGRSLAETLERLRATAQATAGDPEAICDRLLQALLAEGAPDDDVALLVCRTAAQPS